MDFDVVRRAGLSDTEFAKLCGVSRVTANNWRKKRMRPHRLLQIGIMRRLDVIAEAVVTGDLPLSKTVPRKEREKRLVAVLSRVTARMKARTEQPVV